VIDANDRVAGPFDLRKLSTRPPAPTSGNAGRGQKASEYMLFANDRPAAVVQQQGILRIGVMLYLPKGDDDTSLT